MALKIVFIGMLPPDSPNPEERRFVEELRNHALDVVYVRGIGIKGFGSRQIRSLLAQRRDSRASATRLWVTPPRRPMRQINVSWIRRQLTAITLGRSREWVLWVRFPSPELVEAAVSMDFSLTAYEPIDRYEASLDFTPGERRRISRAEARLLSRATVITGGRAMATRLADAAGGVSWLPFGLDRRGWTVSPPPGRRGAHLKIGVVAEFDWRVDEHLIDHLARERPSWEIELVGPRTDKWGARLDGLPNVRFVGRIEPDAIPDHAASFDVALVPYVINDWTRSCLPVKVFEYLAAGRPVVSTELPELDILSDVVVRVPAVDFPSAIEREFLADGPEKRRLRLQASTRFTLQERAARAIDWLASSSPVLVSR